MVGEGLAVVVVVLTEAALRIRNTRDGLLTTSDTVSTSTSRHVPPHDLEHVRTHAHKNTAKNGIFWRLDIQARA